MGCFSWIPAGHKDGQAILIEGRPVYLVCPPGKESTIGGQPRVKESDYEGYGVFGGYDAYALLALWNVPERCTGDPKHDRVIGIEIGCYDEDHRKLKYPLKFSFTKKAEYDELPVAISDPNQGFGKGW